MNDIITTALWLRGIERLAIIAGGVCCIVLGGMLYKWGVFDRMSIKASGQEGDQRKFSFSLQDASPGIVCCILGVVLLAISMWRSLELTVPDIKDSKGVTVVFGSANSQERVSQMEGVLRTIVQYESSPSENEFQNIKSSASAALGRGK